MREGQRTGWRRKTGRQPNHSYLWRERSKGYSAAVVSTQFIFELFAHTSLKKTEKLQQVNTDAPQRHLQKERPEGYVVKLSDTPED